MYTPELPDLQASQLRVMRIVHAALCAGVLTFLVIAVGMRARGAMPPPPQAPLISYVGLAFALGAVVFSGLLPAVLDSAWRRRIAEGNWPQAEGAPAPADPEMRWWALYQTRMIIRDALLEGAAFFQLIAYLVEGQLLSLCLAGGLLLGLALLFPSRTGVERWVATQQELVGQGR